MATTIDKYNLLGEYLMDGVVDVEDGTIKVALVDGYTFSAAHAVWADVSANECTATGNYTTGGETLAGSGVTSAGGTATWDATDLTWTNLTHTFSHAIIYQVVTIDSVTNPLIAAIEFDDTPNDITVAGVDFTIIWSASGIMTLS